MTARRPGLIWRERPTVLQVLAFPFVAVLICLPLALFALATLMVPDMSKAPKP